MAPCRASLFQWGIGINDVDNGIRLPRWLISQKPISLTDATVNAIVHTDVYHAEVHYRLREVARTHPAEPPLHEWNFAASNKNWQPACSLIKAVTDS